MKASSMQNHFDVTRSKCRQTKPIVWATLLILMSRHADGSSSFLYLADLRSMQYGCKFATVCDRKQEYIIEREGEYPTPIYHSVVSLDRGRDLYNVIHTCGISLFVQSNRDMASQRARRSKTTTTWPVSHSLDMYIIKVMSPVKAYYTVVYWSRILSLPLYYILLPKGIYVASFDSCGRPAHTDL